MKKVYRVMTIEVNPSNETDYVCNMDEEHKTLAEAEGRLKNLQGQGVKAYIEEVRVVLTNENALAYLVDILKFNRNNIPQ